MDILFEYIYCLLDFFLLDMLCSIYFNRKRKQLWIKISAIAIFSMFLLIISEYSSQFTDVLNFLLMCVFVELIYVSSKRKNLIVTSFIYYVFNGVFTVFLLSLVSMLTSNELPHFYTPSSVTRIIFVLFSRILIYLILYMISKKKNKIMKPSQITMNYIIIFFVACILMLFILNLAIKKNKDIFAITDIFILMSSLIIMISCVFRSLSLYLFSKMKNTEYENEIRVKNMEKEYYLKSMGINDEVLRLKHDMKNQLTTLEYLLEGGKNEEAIKYLKGMSNNVVFKRMKYSNCMILNAILNYKMSENPDIKFNIYVNANDIKILDIDLTVVLGNALDNAIEAIQKLENANKSIDVTIKREKTLVYIKVVNKAKGIILDKKGNLLTIKEDKKMHNIGMISMRNIADKYNGRVTYDFSDATFTLEIFLFEE